MTDPYEIHRKLKIDSYCMSMTTFAVAELFFICCTYHDTYWCADFLDDWITEMGVIEERDLSLRRIMY